MDGLYTWIDLTLTSWPQSEKLKQNDRNMLHQVNSTCTHLSISWLLCRAQRTQQDVLYEEKSTWQADDILFLRFLVFITFQVMTTLTQLPLSPADCTILTTPSLGRVVTPSYSKSITMRRHFRLLSLRSACLVLNKVERFVWKLLTGSTEAEHWGDMEAVIGLLLRLLGVSRDETLNFLISRF